MLHQRYRSLSLLLAFCLLLGNCVATKPQTNLKDHHNLMAEYTALQVGNPRSVPVAGGGVAYEFDGVDDGLLYEVNPLVGAEAFSIEVVFKPYAGYPENREQRFLHIQDPENENRRILMELRLNSRGEWYPDLFMRSETEALTLIDSTRTHPVGEWARMRLVYKAGKLKGFVNGVEELSGTIHYQPISAAAKTAIGMRMNRVSFFKGAIKEVLVTTGSKGIDVEIP